MNEARNRVVAVGEVMIELSRGEDGRFGMACGGDTFNTAVYLARAGVPTAYATALGDDTYSQRILALAAAESIGTDLVLRTLGRQPGLYVAETDPKGQHRIQYWRDHSPARELFELPDWSHVAEGLLGARLIYFSGITLSLYSNLGLGRFLAVLEMARQKGVRVVFDSNFRPGLWRGDLSRARTICMEALKRVDVALPAFDDEAVLWGDPSPETTVQRLQAFGVGEIAIKNGPGSALVSAAGRQELIPVPETVEPIDTTAAGDSFNAGYMAARLSGQEPAAAAAAGHRLASEKIQHRGAIMPRAAAIMH